MNRAWEGKIRSALKNKLKIKRGSSEYFPKHAAFINVTPRTRSESCRWPQSDCCIFVKQGCWMGYWRCYFRLWRADYIVVSPFLLHDPRFKPYPSWIAFNIHWWFYILVSQIYCRIWHFANFGIIVTMFKDSNCSCRGLVNKSALFIFIPLKLLWRNKQINDTLCALVCDEPFFSLRP